MSRTIVNLEPEDKEWLDRVAASERLPMTEVVRRAVRQYRRQYEKQAKGDFEELLRRTKGCWTQDDGLNWQRKIRDEWKV